jgi:hypothetical protein
MCKLLASKIKNSKLDKRAVSTRITFVSESQIFFRIFTLLLIDQKTRLTIYFYSQVVMCGYLLVILFLFSVLELRTECQSFYDDINDMAIHSRRKRYLVFPDGSTFSVSA